MKDIIPAHQENRGRERESEKLNGIPPIIKGTPPKMEVPVSGFYIKTKES
jgi:hypothetical protein